MRLPFLLATLMLSPLLLAAGEAGSLPGTDARHWAFEPVRGTVPPPVRDLRWPRQPLDRFILARLESEGLGPSPEADRGTWLRRVTLDLTGLPPTPAAVDAFLADTAPDAEGRVVDALLASPRHGERWAQHWLDVVRYADTHGFEVNTERPNAWPYRDYVIGAFNADLPYDRFVREQIAGDQLGADAATGFLVTASVLLPGQIGADDVSKRLARQDALDEIVVNTGQAFLGLSIGCARCHDHKFDPITARDYYAMQAFFAGVEYDDREIRSDAQRDRRREAVPLERRVSQLEQALSRFEPVARVGPSPRPTDARLNEEEFPAMEARYVRFTIHDANRHPTLGWIEPCLDEVEILSDEAIPRNVALASLGTKVTASGSRTSEKHQLAHLNDGLPGNRHSWMSDQPGRGWVQFELPEPARIRRVVWSRDREGMFSDRLPTAYTLEAGTDLESLRTLVHVPPPRPGVKATVNSDRFAPITAHRLRFTIGATLKLEPCIDELEVFDTEAHNVALASAGTLVTTSGDTVVEGRHQRRHLNDGQYGNSRSWMSDQTGRGWVVLDFPGDRRVERVVWGRDRLGEFSDRLATDYRIEVADASGNWRTVATSADRRPPGSAETGDFPSTAGLSRSEAAKVGELLTEKKGLESRIASLKAGQLAFAGTFRKPDVIHRLHRGDPEQPKEEVGPAIPAALGGSAWSTDLAEPERRLALANWLASPANPLTARVLVNRVWQGHFGAGLVETPSDFGKNGSRPSHPELLDWLAAEFLADGQSLKRLHRRIVLSATYRQSARIRPEAAARDVDDHLLWRYPSRRLESEPIRDALLAVSGKLDLSGGGRGFNLFDNRGGLSGFKPVESFTGEGLRRMIYAHKVRREREVVFGAFDCPDAGQSTARRRESTTPIQALNLFNSRFTLEQSDAFAARVKAEAGTAPEAWIRHAYRLALGRSPTATEWADVPPLVRDHGLPVLCRALLNSNEFLFLP